MKAEDWIKVSDNLPKIEEDVLVYDDAMGIVMAWHNEFYGWHSCEGATLESVTHWMPIVLPNKEG